MAKSILSVLLIVLAVPCFAQTPPLQITSPSTGTTVAPGTTVAVSVSAEPSVVYIAVVGEFPIGVAQRTSDPMLFSLSIPVNIRPDQYRLAAVGLTATGDVASLPITLDIEPPTAPVGLRVEPTILLFSESGDMMPLRVTGTFNDGSSADISHSTNTGYASTNTGVATVDDNGLVTAAAPGSASIQVTNAAVTSSVPVTVTSAISGGGYFFPETAAYRATFSMNVTGPAEPYGWLQYYYMRTRMKFVSTGIATVSISDNTATITGIGAVNGATGYTFTVTVTTGDFDTFSITIKNIAGTTYYSAGPLPISGGDLTIS